MDGEKLVVASMNTMFTLTTITSSPWADILQRKFRQEL